ncbi:phosphatidylserine decarboxylase [Inmirania thermothiophila]|uniref:Phosphatidylserine decarboxylase n=1 Tax=Inmirania thermothiophila TaxID=1750597 RepID=A0A3N1Y8K2_9GAMM|nr:phosphatidylserine decarboxylase [Inmirania thermothiophila]ROR35090.1 phosphatidylserine decarboxylase [Inmirania thermothiophila]
MILPEGRYLAALGVAAALAAAAADRPLAAAAAAALGTAAAWLFRDPERAVPAVPLGIVSPCDGRVLRVGRVRDPFLGREAVEVAIRMPLLGGYVLRAPVEGRVMELGRPPFVPEGEDGDAVGVWLRTDEGDDVVLVLPGRIGRGRVRLAVRAGERLGQGQRCGRVRLGTEVGLLLPATSRIGVQPGTRLLAGSHLVGELVHAQPREAATA